MIHAKLLITLFTIEILILIYYLLKDVYSTSSYIADLGYAPLSILIWLSTSLLLLASVSTELVRFRSSRLTSRFYAINHVFRVVIYISTFVYSLQRLLRIYGHVPFFGYLLVDVIQILTVCVGLVYGFQDWRRQARSGYSIFKLQINPDVDLLWPSKINTTNDLQTREDAASSVLFWMYQPLKKFTANSATYAIANSVYLWLKWPPGIMASIFAIAFQKRMPSEPKSQYVIERSEFLNWEYLKPRIPRIANHHDEHSSVQPLTTSTSEGRLPGLRKQQRERGSDTLSLHTLIDDLEAPLSRHDTTDLSDVDTNQTLGPRFLCYLDDQESCGYKTRSTETWAQDQDTDRISNYVFISYTRRQFYTLISGDPSLPQDQNETLLSAAQRDTKTLTEYAVRAAKAIPGVEAFWIDFECVRPEEGERPEDSMEDVYRICDVVRASTSMAIVTGPSLLENKQHDPSQTSSRDWLHDWGRRLWTVPEALLCPSAEHRISVYKVGTLEPEMVAKRNLAKLVWDDAGSLKRLIDHYESSVSLSRLQLITFSLECFQRRQTEKRMSGDVAYALMGLLRQRPPVNKSDTAFQAFAKLCLANDDDQVLERLLCISHSSSDPWHDMTDRFGAKVWDINPLCQVSRLSKDDNQIILGNSQGCIINFSYLSPVDYAAVSTNYYRWHLVRHGPASLIVFLFIWCFFMSIVSLIAGDGPLNQKALLPFHISFLAPCAIFLAASVFAPKVLRSLYSREIHDVQARMFGVQGVANLDRVEEVLLGRATGRIQWVDARDPNRRLEQGEQPQVYFEEEALQAYTLIDTWTQSAMVFTARRPPNVAVVCGRERGFARTLLCSYDKSNNCLMRESVVRLESTVLDRMPQLDHIKISF